MNLYEFWPLLLTVIAYGGGALGFMLMATIALMHLWHTRENRTKWLLMLLAALLYVNGMTWIGFTAIDAIPLDSVILHIRFTFAVAVLCGFPALILHIMQHMDWTSGNET